MKKKNRLVLTWPDPQQDSSRGLQDHIISLPNDHESVSGLWNRDACSFIDLGSFVKASRWWYGWSSGGGKPRRHDDLPCDKEGCACVLYLVGKTFQPFFYSGDQFVTVLSHVAASTNHLVVQPPNKLSEPLEAANDLELRVDTWQPSFKLYWATPCKVLASKSQF